MEKTQEELDQMETEAYADLAVEDWERPQGESVQELAEAHLQAELERNHKYYWNDKYAI